MRRAARRVLPLLLTAGFLYFVLRRIPYERLLAALGEADYVRFLAFMIPNTIIYVAWDTFVLAVAVRWFHGPVRYRDLLPVRAASYIVSVLNTNAGRGALAVLVGRLLDRPTLQIGSTVIFLVLTEYTHLVAWATLGIVAFGSELTQPILWVPPAVAGFWLLFFAYARAGRTYASGPPEPTATALIRGWLTAPWRGALLRTFRLAPARRYVEVVLLRAPMFFVSLCLHYFAAPAFGFSIPFGHMLTFLPVVFMAAALPITVARLGTTQAAWILLFGGFAPTERLLAFSLATALTFALTRALIGVMLLPLAYRDLVEPVRAREPERHAAVAT
jgi:hypothetical protein